MMVLAVETATPRGSVSLVDEAGVILERSSDTSVTHARWLMPAIGQLLAEQKLSLQEVGGFAISTGPGSFTGLRIGLSTVKGLGLATGKPIVAVSTLDAMAELIPRCQYPICPILDARKREVYAARYRRSGDEVRRESAYVVLPPRALAESIAERTLFLGTGVDLYRDLLSECLGKRALFASQRFRYPRAGTVGRLGLRRLIHGQVDSLDQLEPLYVRPSEAELKKADRQQRQQR